jgi:hypothetical protein
MAARCRRSQRWPARPDQDNPEVPLLRRNMKVLKHLRLLKFENPVHTETHHFIN